jgi:transcriptional regulator with XRE-family HTH domain
VIVSISFVLLLNPSGLSPSSYGQIVGDANQTNQISDQNSVQQTQQQLEQANQQLAQANQTQQQVSNQTQQQLEQANQTQPHPDPELIEKLLNFTNVAILALNEDDTNAAQVNIVEIQNALINASGKQVVIIPASAILTSDEDSD